MPIIGIKKVGQAFSKLIDERLNLLYFRIRAPILEVTPNIIKNSLRDHPTHQKIASGAYNDNFGFFPGSAEIKLNVIVETLIDRLDIKLSKVGRLVHIEAKVDYDILYTLEAAKQQNDSYRSRKGLTPTEIPWLQWLLEKGGTVVIGDFHMQLGTFEPKRSRSREAIMVEGGDWSVPAAIQGLPGDNWITQSFDNSEPRLTNYIRNLITTELKHL